eukprot:1158786-Pelagomonas_calceolata.AAC.9
MEPALAHSGIMTALAHMALYLRLHKVPQPLHMHAVDLPVCSSAQRLQRLSCACKQRLQLCSSVRPHEAGGMKLPACKPQCMQAWCIS